MRVPRRLLAAAGVASAVLLATALPASAITGGEPDGERHPNVAAIFFYEPGGRFRCSATLISPTVLVTAAHCTTRTLGKTLVTFTSVIASQPPTGLPLAADPTVGYTHDELAAAGYLSGTASTHPQYSHGTDLKNWNDVGVIVLDTPVSSITPAVLAPANYLDAYEQPILNETIFDLVGYGAEVTQADSGPQQPQPVHFPLLRRYTTAPGQKLTPQLLQINGNPEDDRGGGGTCIGDSGGPVLLNGYLVAVTSFGYNQICRYIDANQRVDIAVVQDWLATY